MIDLLAFAYGLSIRLALAGLTQPVSPSWPEQPSLSSSFAYFLPKEKSVANWRLEAARHIEPTDAAAKIFTALKTSPPRCVKLNNYWCVKHAGWNGTLGIDSESHVAFASVLEGATVAALLLKRYYVDYRRKTGRAIVSRWAPSSCGLSASAAAPRPIPKTMNTPKTAIILSPHGGTVTMIARQIRPQGRPARQRFASRLPRSHSRARHNYSLEMMHAPEIAVGMGEDSLTNALRTSIKTSTSTRVMTTTMTSTMTFPTTTPLYHPLTSPETLDPLLSTTLPMTACLDDPRRIENYAVRASQGVTDNPDSDLHLFDANGAPTPNLARVLANMAQVEIGPLDVRKDLIEEAIERARRQWAETAAKQTSDASTAAAPSKPEAVR